MADEEELDSGDPEFIKRQDQKRTELDEQLREYIMEWRKNRAKEEEDLKKLKEKQAKRKVARAEEEKKAQERKKQDEERKIKEIEEKKIRDHEEKIRRLEEAEKKRQAMMQALKEQAKNKGPNFVVSRKQAADLSDVEKDRNKTKEQLEEEKKVALNVRIKPLAVDALSVDKLKEKAQELYDSIVKLETEIYDLEEKENRQGYDLKELKERQRQQLRHKALKKGLDPEALTGKYPPKIQVSSKYERRVDTRSYDDKKKMFEGGFDLLTLESVEKNWKEKMQIFDSRTRTKLPKWYGERPGKKPGDPDTPEGEEEGKVEDVGEEEVKEPEPEPESDEDEEVEIDEEEEDDDDDEDEDDD